MDIEYCTGCGAPTELKIPADDDHARSICTRCGRVHYDNPKMVVGCIPELNGQVLLCKRNIEPRKGKWTLPAGYLENGESVQDGAVRETREETLADVENVEPYRVFNIVSVHQVYFMFRADLVSDNFGPTSESSEVRLFQERDIPWDEIAFSSIQKTLEHYFKDRKTDNFLFKIFDII